MTCNAWLVCCLPKERSRRSPSGFGSYSPNATRPCSARQASQTLRCSMQVSHFTAGLPPPRHIFDSSVKICVRQKFGPLRGIVATGLILSSCSYRAGVSSPKRRRLEDLVAAMSLAELRKRQFLPQVNARKSPAQVILDQIYASCTFLVLKRNIIDTTVNYARA